jgi:hypothetical protein
MVILERLLNKARTYAFDLDTQESLDTMSRDWLLVMLHHKGITGCLYHLKGSLLLAIRE